MSAPTADQTQDLIGEGAKPTFLRRVRIQGYKSIVFCDVSLEPLTILVGRNASGKSNFLDALAFVTDLMDQRATEAVTERNGWHSIHSRNALTPSIEIAFEARFISAQAAWDAEYSFALEKGDKNQVSVRSENLVLRTVDKSTECGYHLTGGQLEWTGAGTEGTRFFAAVGDDRLLLSVIGEQPFVDLAEALRSSQIYSFSPAAMREPERINASPILARDGANLARAIEGLREIEPETVERLRKYLMAIVPGVIDFQTIAYGDFETVRFRLEPKNGPTPYEFDASSMSDGTLRVLAALVAAYQIVLPGSYPGFIGIEEPEVALHPAAMRALVDALDEATLRTQILLTTHSAEMLDNPSLRPANIRVVDLIGNETVIAPIDQASVEIARRKLNTLGGLERDNLLEPDLDDVQRQRLLKNNRVELPT